MRSIHAVILVVALGGAGCQSPPVEPPIGSDISVEKRLAAWTTAFEISQYVGPFPRICFQAGSGNELCEWQAGDRDPGWSSLAAAIGTRDRINVLCEVPQSGEPRAPGSCTAHPRRSNRYSWKWGEGQRAIHQKTAAKAFDNARSLTEMSRLMGSAPEGCVTSHAQLICLWRTDDQTFGHGTLAMWIRAPISKKIRLRCIFPLDGSPRGVESCSASVGG